MCIFLAQCLMSLFLRKPDFVRARPSTLLTDNRISNQVYYKELGGNGSVAKSYSFIPHIDELLWDLMKKVYYGEDTITLLNLRSFMKRE